MKGKLCQLSLTSISLSESSEGGLVCLPACLPNFLNFLPSLLPSLDLILYSHGSFLSANLRLNGLDKNVWLSHEISLLNSGLSLSSYLLIAESSPLVPFPSVTFLWILEGKMNQSQMSSLMSLLPQTSLLSV